MEALGNQLEPLRATLYQVGAFLPRLVMGLLILLVGWLVAKAVRIGTEKALRAFNFNVLFERSGLDTFLRQGGARSDTIRVFGLLTFWLVLLLAAVAAATTMGLPNVSDLLRRVVWFLPRLFIGLLILAGGSYFARFVGDTVASYGRSAKLRDAAFLGKVAQYAIMVFVILVTLDQTQIGGDLIRQSFLVILTGLVFALALAFGLGGRNWASERIDSWWPTERRGEAGDATRPGSPPGPAAGGRRRTDGSGSEPGRAGSYEPGRAGSSDPGRAGSSEPGRAGSYEPWRAGSYDPGRAGSYDPGRAGRPDPGSPDTAPAGNPAPGRSDDGVR